MKKYITVAALLAAGTAFASADVVIKDLSQSTSGFDAETGLLTGTGLFEAGDRYVASTTIKLDLSKISFDDSTYTYTGSDVTVVQYSKDGTSSGAVGLTLTTEGVRFVYQGARYMDTHYISWEALKEDSFVEGSSSYVVLTLESSKALNATGGGTFVYDGEGNAYASSASETGAAFGASGLKTSTQYNTIYLNNDYVSAVYVTPGIASKEQIAFASSTIPEPSAFGMLAGLVGLALVASRRRRK
ncbi:MAG: hypothetical protein IJX22_00240 [Opitutales bacterium]|nr:hypothetical protein [Opitutales bacterium]